MTLKSEKAIWDFLTQGYKGNEKVNKRTMLNFMGRRIEMQPMNDIEINNKYILTNI